MYYYQYLIILVLIVLLFVRASRYGALILLIDQLSYLLFISDISAEAYYSLSATINILAGFALHKKYKLSAICSYCLVFINIYGYGLWYLYYPPLSYDVVTSLVVVIQLIGILPSDNLDRIRRLYDKYIVAKRLGFNRR